MLFRSLRRILQNLIGNAIRYTDRGRVLVGARRRAGTIRLEVHDTGPGIPEDEQDNVFKEFHRLNAPASASEGMGLGLAIVERACGLLGHPLTLLSQPGRGTTFQVQVPLAESPSAEGLDAPPPQPAPPEAANRIVLLVENDAPLRRAMALLLEKWGAQVLEAESGEAALGLIDELGILPDGCLVDQNLGAGMDGTAFVRALQARHGPLPATLVSASQIAPVANPAGAGAIPVLTKPLQPRALQDFLSGLG